LRWPPRCIDLRRNRDGIAESSQDPSRQKFGSEHSGISQYAFLDGRVQVLAHAIDMLALQLLTSIADGEAISSEHL